MNDTNSIRRKEFLRAMQVNTDLCGDDCEEALRAIMVTLEHFMSNDCRVNWHGFGTFEPKDLQAISDNRLGHDINLPARKSVKFTPSKSLKERINEQ